MSIFTAIINWALAIIGATGYLGLFLAMMLESAGVPIPSEVVLPFAGFLAASGKFSLILVIVVATTANLTGALIFFTIGYFGGTRFLRKYGHFLFIREKEISRMERWLDRHGGKVAFFSRMLPGVRTYSSLVIGSGRSKLWTFITYTFLGSVIWNSIWAYLGYYTGSRWEIFGPYVRKFDYLILGLVIAYIVIFFIRHFRKKN
jgi:membrane protein DedA with SNARE-associated domain